MASGIPDAMKKTISPVRFLCNHLGHLIAFLEK